MENLPAALRRAWLDGDWGVFAGQYFTEWDERVHTCAPFAIPAHWRRYFTMDYGLDMLAGYCIAVDEDGWAWVYRELYRSGLIISQAAEAILQMTAGECIDCWFAPPDLYNRRQDTGRSAAEIFADHSIPLTRAQNDRVAGWLDLKEWLRPVGDGGEKKAALTVFFNCSELVRCLPLLQFDSHRRGDVAGEPHELTHAPDAIRYFVAGRPVPALPPAHQAAVDTPIEDQFYDFLRFGG